MKSYARTWAGNDASLRDSEVAVGQTDDSSAADATNDGCVLEESLWDASLLVGIQGQGALSSAWTVKLLLLNIIAQGLFTFIVIVDLTSREINENAPAGFRAWRRNIAHSSANVDAITGVSLAARVCHNHVGLEASTSQAAMFAAIKRYEEYGELLVVLCLFVWFNTVIADISGALRMIAAAIQSRGKATKMHTSASTGKFCIVQLSNNRVAWFVCVQSIRLVIAVTLGYGTTPSQLTRFHMNKLV